MTDLSHIALIAASLFFAASVVTILFVSTRQTKAQRLREARRQARTARLSVPAGFSLPAHDLNPEPDHAARNAAGR